MIGVTYEKIALRYARDLRHPGEVDNRSDLRTARPWCTLDILSYPCIIS